MTIALYTRAVGEVTCEVVGFSEGNALVMPFGAVDGIGMGARAEVSNAEPVIYPSDEWQGRVMARSGSP